MSNVFGRKSGKLRFQSPPRSASTFDFPRVTNVRAGADSEPAGDLQHGIEIERFDGDGLPRIAFDPHVSVFGAATIKLVFSSVLVDSGHGYTLDSSDRIAQKLIYRVVR